MKQWNMKEKERPAYVTLKEGSLVLKSVKSQVEDAKILLEAGHVKTLYLSDKDGRGYASIHDGDSFQVISLKIEDNNTAYATIDQSSGTLSSQDKKEPSV